MARARRTRSFGELAADVVKKADPKGRRFGAEAVAAWPEVVGPEIAGHTRGFALRERGELVVFVDRAAWATQLAAMAEEIRTRLNTHLGHTRVRSIRFTVSRNVAAEAQWVAREEETEDYYAPDGVESAPLDQVERSQVEHVVSVVTNPVLRRLASRVMVLDLERRKGAQSDRGQTGS